MTNVVELRGVSIFHSRTHKRGVRRNQRGDMVLNDINLSIKQGEMVYVIGKVGSGKSTFLKTLYAELPLFVGEGNLVGFDLRRLKRRQVPHLRRQMGIVFQDYQLLADRNVFNNLHYVMRATGWRDEADIRRKIEEVLKLVGLQNKTYKMPFELSGGEQQRLAIARAMINEPKIILADEPTGNLDPASSEEVMELFQKIVESGCSIIMSTHNLHCIQMYPAKTLRCSKNRLEEIDTTKILG